MRRLGNHLAENTQVESQLSTRFGPSKNTDSPERRTWVPLRIGWYIYNKWRREGRV